MQRTNVIVAAKLAILALAIILAPSISFAQALPSKHTGLAYQFEMHWGFIRSLEADTGDTSSTMAMDGEITFSDSDPNTKEGIHLISALLFEHEGEYEDGRDDAIVDYKEMGSKISWHSSTTNDWDGIAVSLRYDVGTNPNVAIVTSQWSWSGAVEELKKLNTVVSLGEGGQQLEIGRFFTLSYKVYDLALVWGYNMTLDTNTASQTKSIDWSGSLSISAGGIRLLFPISFEWKDIVSQKEDLSPNIEWVSTTTDSKKRPLATDGLALNLIVPKGAEVYVTIYFKSYGEKSFKLPERFKDVHNEMLVDDQGHFIHAHLHWCWFKKS